MARAEREREMVGETKSERLQGARAQSGYWADRTEAAVLNTRPLSSFPGIVSKYQAVKGHGNEGGVSQGERLGCSHIRCDRRSPRSPRHPPGSPLPGL